MADLSEYEVPHRNGTMTVQLTDDDAEQLYGDRARRVGAVTKAEPVAVTRPPYAVDADETGAPVEPGEGKRVPNKARTSRT